GRAIWHCCGCRVQCDATFWRGFARMWPTWETRMVDGDALKKMGRPHGMPFRIGKLGRVVINVRDVARSVRFYTEVLGFEVSDVYPDEMVPGGMAFLRCNPDHPGIALVGSLPGAAETAELNRTAF